MTLDVSGVSVELGGQQILDAIDTTVEDGSFVGIVGPNGAGKTTLLRTINAALSPDTGAVYLDEEDVHTLGSRAASRRLATVPQHTDLSFDFTVREVVEMGRHPHRSRFGHDDDGDVVDRALVRTAIEHLADRPITDVSGGERQRVLLARALAQDAPVLLLDEPTASLDVNHQVRTLDLVADLVAEGRTAIAAIHDLDLAARYCDELLLVADGEIIASGSPSGVLTPGTLAAAFGVRVAVTPNPVTGSPTVTALADQTSAEPTGERDDADPNAVRAVGDLAVHVLGGRDAAPLFGPLATAGAPVSVGPVPEGSRDATVARNLDLDVITTPPFETPDNRTRSAARDRIDRADVVVVPERALDLGVNAQLAQDASRLVVTGEPSQTSAASVPRDAVRVEPGAIVEGVVAAATNSALDRLVRPPGPG